MDDPDAPDELPDWPGRHGFDEFVPEEFRPEFDPIPALPDCVPPLPPTEPVAPGLRVPLLDPPMPEPPTPALLPDEPLVPMLEPELLPLLPLLPLLDCAKAMAPVPSTKAAASGCKQWHESARAGTEKRGRDARKWPRMIAFSQGWLNAGPAKMGRFSTFDRRRRMIAWQRD